MQTPTFNNQSRLLLIAPHPDDESLACGLTLQAAVRAGAAVRVIYATDGDNNPWPQRFVERRWKIRQADRLRWGRLRRGETQKALLTLGLQPEDARFLGLPDQGLTDRLLHDHTLLSLFLGLIEDFRPTDIVFPSTADAHPDHNALAVTLLLILPELSPAVVPPSLWQYAVHGKNPAFFDQAHPVCATPAEIAIKVRAIECHQTQLKLSRKRFLRYARRPERFVRLTSAVRPVQQGAPQILGREADQLAVSLPPQKKLFPNDLHLFVIGRSGSGDLRSAIIRLSRKSAVAEMVDCQTGIRTSLPMEGSLLTGTQVNLPIEAIFSPQHPIFLKLSRRSLGFADAGWCEVPPIGTLLAATKRSHRDPVRQTGLTQLAPG